MKVTLAAVRSGRTSWADAAAADYGRRIGRYFPFEEVSVRTDAEIARLVPVRGKLVLFDERGADLTSEAFAALLTRSADAGITRLVFAIGGAYGFDSARGDAVRLSAMVMNHAVARVVALEQIYRACTIRAGEPYHHG